MVCSNEIGKLGRLSIFKLSTHHYLINLLPPPKSKGAGDMHECMALFPSFFFLFNQKKHAYKRGVAYVTARPNLASQDSQMANGKIGSEGIVACLIALSCFLYLANKSIYMQELLEKEIISNSRKGKVWRKMTLVPGYCSDQPITPSPRRLIDLCVGVPARRPEHL